MLWYGDWLRAKQAQPEKNATILAQQLGFARLEKPTQQTQQASPNLDFLTILPKRPAAPEKNTADIEQTQTTEGQAIDYMLRAIHYEHQAKDEDEEAAERPEFLKNLKLQSHAELLQQEQEGSASPPATQLMIPWRRLGSILRQRLRRTRKLRRLDIPQTIRLLASGRTLRHLPRQSKQTWPRVLHLWRDTSLHATGVQDDYADIQHHLAQWLGNSRLDVSLMKHGPNARVYRKQSETLPKPTTGEAVLILGDLSLNTESWAQWGKQFQHNAVNAQALHPVGSNKPPAGIQAIAWESHAKPQNTKLSEAVEKLLVYTSAALFIEPGLIRAIRALDNQIPAAAELAIWHSTAIEPTWQGIFHKPETIRHQRYQKQFAALPPKLKKDIARLIIQHHAHWRMEPRAEELRQLKLLGAKISPAEDKLQQNFFQQLALQMEQGKAPADSADWLRQIYRRQGLAQLENTDEAYAFALLQAEKAKILADPTAWPWGIPLRYSGSIQAKITECTRTLYDTPDGLVLSTQKLGKNTPIISITDTGWLSLKQGKLDQERFVLPHERNFLLPIQPSVGDELENSGFSIITSEARIEFAYAEKPAWAQEIGYDPYGLYAEVEIANQNFKMRWIPPSTFLMGSSGDELERLSWESPQHQVTFEHGYWLAETVCTQTLWQAVMGGNPSYFNNSKQNPAESISWKMAHSFIQQINRQHPELMLRLPSEAEWEHACRAGTKTRYTFGDKISRIQANFGRHKNATVPVKTYQPNAWGLYQMHGNVWEWCQDEWHSNYKNAPTDGSVWQTSANAENVRRIVRGGSWDVDRWTLSSPNRDWANPNNMYFFLGFRLARSN